MDLEQTIKEALILQDNLNKTIDPGWKTNRVLEDWVIAINQEFAELMDSLNWAWWKKNSPNIDNVKVELVDILHFLLSWTLQYNFDQELDLIAFIISIEGDVEPCKDNPQSVMKAYMDFLFALQMAEENSDCKTVYFGIEWKAFFRIVKAFMSIEELFKMYVFKNALNKLRKDFGYKEGKYRKVWNGKEDNEVMLELMKNLKEVNFETAYNLLREKYLEVCND